MFRSVRAESIVFYCFLLVVVGIALFDLATSGLCDNRLVREAVDPMPSQGQPTALGCREFWLNRYQEFLAGFLGLMAALVAAYLVFAQLRTMNQAHALERQNAARQRINELPQVRRLGRDLQKFTDSVSTLKKNVANPDRYAKTGRKPLIEEKVKELRGFRKRIQEYIDEYQGGPAINTLLININKDLLGMREDLSAMYEKYPVRSPAATEKEFVEQNKLTFETMQTELSQMVEKLRAIRKEIRNAVDTERTRVNALIIDAEKST